jgi:hypothetical protein
MIAVGVARPRAQGQAIIKTATKLSRAKVSAGAGLQRYHRIKVIIATTITAGTK